MFRKEFNRIFEENDSDKVYDFELIGFVKDVILPNKAKIPRLFRFSRADYYNIRGLETESLFLSPIGTMNDVFEGLSSDASEKALKHLDEIGEMAYIKSFSENWENLLMWAHYADSYKGMCVEYDFSQVCPELFYHLFPVYYSRKRFLHQELEYSLDEMHDLKKANDECDEPIDVFYIQDILSLFLVKPQVWEYEKEWRFIATYPQLNNSADDIDDEEPPQLYMLNSQTISVKNCIKGVYLGPRIGKLEKEHIKEICESKLGGIPVYSLSLSNEDYAFVKKQE